MLKRNSKGIWFGEWNHYVDGQRKRIRRSSGTKIKAQAEEWHRKVDEELWRHFKLGEVVRYWEDAVLVYLRGREQNDTYDADLARLEWLQPHLSGKRLEQINKELLEQIRDARRAVVAASTTNRMMVLISAILHHAEELEWITRAPKIPKCKIVPALPVYLTPDEASALVKELASLPRTKHLVAYVTFAIATGQRMSNVTKLEWPQINLVNRTMTVAAEDSKNRKHLSIPLADDAVEVIKDQMGKHQSRVFTYRGKPFAKVNNRTLQGAAKRAGISKRVHNHLFRHTFASWHVMRGTSLYELMSLGGWSKIESVMIYAHLSAEHMLTAASNRDTIAGVFAEARELMK